MKAYELIELDGGKVAVAGPDYASKALFRGLGRVKFETVQPGKSAWIVESRYRRQAEQIVARQNGTAVTPTVSRPTSASRRHNTSSGWCQACEDGATNLCKRGGCY